MGSRSTVSVAATLHRQPGLLGLHLTWINKIYMCRDTVWSRRAQQSTLPQLCHSTVFGSPASYPLAIDIIGTTVMPYMEYLESKGNKALLKEALAETK